MLTPRIVLGSVVLFAMVRFFMTPTWPCAVVVLGALVVAFANEALGVWRRAGDVSALLVDLSGLKSASAATAGALRDVSERVGALERGRALGGL